MRVTRNIAAPAPSASLVNKTSRELHEFIKASPEQRRKIAQLICSISERMGKEGLDLLQDFSASIANNDLEAFSKRWASKKVPLSIMSDLLALSQEMEADTREKVDSLILKAKKGLIQLGKQGLVKAIALL